MTLDSSETSDKLSIGEILIILSRKPVSSIKQPENGKIKNERRRFDEDWFSERK